MKHYKIIGLMSGTSLDGLDIALCDFTFDKEWDFRILEAETIPYSPGMKSELQTLATGSALDFVRAHVAFGKYCGELVAKFVKKTKYSPDFVASHGHTLFHQPLLGYTCQLGDGAALAVASGFPVVCDFRTVDVALGGQGAPLVPIGDQLLFGKYTYCLNLGGIANISFDKSGSRIAFDICGCNILLNHIAQKSGFDYDENGTISAAGKVSQRLLDMLNEQEYFSRPIPKSLGREDVQQILSEILDSNEDNLSSEDQLATVVEHIALKIAKHSSTGTMYVTGGGAFNSHLINRIKKFSKATIVLPDPLLINYKEALIFAFLGLKRWNGELNCLKSVTGARSDSIGGAIYLGAV
ncbi:MAG: anhydro-N-acetylmuramic acid kinase [Bacteroidia bacterium]|nr:anhydro-N-acetylmuramic acid kinase [Bacteroidia bacterium]